jgi:hypothetical protein
MSRTFLGLAVLVAAGLPAASVSAATVAFSASLAPPSAAAIAAGVPANECIAKFFVTTDADILSVNQVITFTMGGPFFQVPPPFGSDTEPPDPAFLSLNRALEADSWITTPGATSKLGGGSGFPGDGTGTWGDLSNDGPRANFQFAQLTIPDGQGGTFHGRISVAGASGPEAFEFVFPFCIPEPSTGLLLALGALVGLRARRGR